jgi:drug/metabolite transporter (DMT)-like permease
LLWIPLRWLDSRGLGIAWVNLIFSAMMFVTPLPWVLRHLKTSSITFNDVVGSLTLGLAFMLYLVSFLFTEIANTIMLYYLTPAWSVIIGMLFLGERPEWQRVLAIIFGFAGIYAVLGHETGLPVPTRIGDWTALASGILWSVGSVMIANRQRGIALPASMFGLGGLISSVPALFAMSLFAPPSATAAAFGPNLVPAILIAMVIFVPPNVMILWSQQRLDAARVGILLMGELIVGTATAAVFSGEHFTVMHAVGAALILLAGVVEVGFQQKKSETVS